MSFDRPLHGGCHCGRNRYIIQFPQDKPPGHIVQVLFDSRTSQNSSHFQATGSPLPAYLRVPLTWYHSITSAFNPDETNAQIKRVYTSPREQHAMRHFCGFCGTPLSYWTEEPRSEAEFIQLTLGSLSPRDLADLEDLGFLPSPGSASGSDEEEAGETGAGERDDVSAMLDEDATRNQQDLAPPVGRVGVVPWFETLTEGSRLDMLRKAKGQRMNKSGVVRVEWEVVEWSEEEDLARPRNGKRKISELDETPGMEGLQGGGK